MGRRRGLKNVGEIWWADWGVRGGNELVTEMLRGDLKQVGTWEMKRNNSWWKEEGDSLCSEL